MQPSPCCCGFLTIRFFPGRVQKENRIESTSVRRNSSRSIVVSVGAIQRMRANAYQRCTTIPGREKEREREGDGETRGKKHPLIKKRPVKNVSTLCAFVLRCQEYFDSFTSFLMNVNVESARRSIRTIVFCVSFNVGHDQRNSGWMFFRSKFFSFFIFFLQILT